MSSASGIRAGRAFIELGVSDLLTAGLKKAQAQLKAFGAGLKSVGTGMMGIGAAALAPLAGAVKVFADSGSALNDMAARTGVSVEALSELEYAAKMTGVEMEGLEGGLRKMQKTVGEAAMGSDSAAEALGKLGLSAADLTAIAPDQQFELLANRLDQVRDPALRASVAMEIFGKSGTNLLPMMQGGAAGVQALRNAARSMGLTMSTETAAAADALGDSLDGMWMVAKRLVATVGEALAPAVTELAGVMTRALTGAIAWARENKQLIVTAAEVAAGVFAAGAALYAIGTAITTTMAVGSALATVLAGVAAAVGALLTPLGVVTAAVAGLGVYIVGYTGAGGQALAWLSDQFDSLSAVVGEVLAGIRAALAAGDIGLAADVLWASLKLAWQTGVNALNQVWVPVKAAFLGAFADMWYGAQAVAEDAWSGLTAGWIETTSFFSATWQRFTSFMSDTWNTLANVLAKTWNWLKGLFDDTFDVAAANLAADMALVDKLGGNAAEQKQALADIEARRKKRRGAEDDRHQRRLEEIGGASLETEQGLNLQASEGLKQAQEALEAAQQALRDSVTTAKEARPRTAAEIPGLPKLPTPGDLGAIIARQEKLSVMSTFDVSAAWGFGAQSAQDKTVGRLDKLIEHVKRISEKVGVTMDH
jgi:hypothetical protein